MSRRRRWILGMAGLGVAILVVSAWFGMRKPEESIFVSFPESDRWSYTATHTVFGGPGLHDYGVRSGLVTKEPWATAAPKIERDLRAAGFRRKGGTPRLSFWLRSDARVFVSAPDHSLLGGTPDVTTASVARSATTPEAVRSWVRDHLTGNAAPP